MNKNLIIGLVVFVVLLIGIGGYVLSQNRSQSTPQNSAQNGTSQTPTSTAGNQKKTLKSLMSMSNQTCTFEDVESGSTGTVYIDSGKFRGDFSSKVNNTVTGSHMVSDGSNYYVWMDNSKEGFKMSAEAVYTVNNTQMAVDVNKEANYSCTSWSVDSSKFTVPTNITFTDYSAMMEDAANMMQGTNSGTTNSTNNAAACAACNNLTGDMKTQCLSALKCN